MRVQQQIAKRRANVCVRQRVKIGEVGVVYPRKSTLFKVVYVALQAIHLGVVPGTNLRCDGASNLTGWTWW